LLANMVIETDENSELRELRSQLADTEQERNDFCAMVVDLETKLLESNTTSSPRPSSEELAQLQQRTAAAERLIRTSGADRADLEAKCAEYRQQGEQQRRTAYDLEVQHRKLQRDYADLSEQIYEAEQAKTILVDEKAAALVRQNAEFLQLQEELALALTECEANVAALRISERLNTQLREDLDKMRGDVELLLASETERMTLATSVATLEDDGKAKTAKLKQLLALQTEYAAKAEADLSTVQQRAPTQRDWRRWRESLMQ